MTIFKEEQNYQFFIRKMVKQVPPAAILLGYCIMPNHFHLVLVPKGELRSNVTLDGSRNNFMPTLELSEANRRWLMGFTKSYNKFYGLTGSRWRPHGWSKHHDGPLQIALDYLHYNPTKAGLVDHPSEWGFSSFNEYNMNFPPEDCICDVVLGRKLLTMYS